MYKSWVPIVTPILYVVFLTFLIVYSPYIAEVEPTADRANRVAMMERFMIGM